ncbi:hypothetical protein BS50DRAFT_253455 [Corynespora cassiicola Philippines]|uniref:Uncharacterized protein n=1 Tax=Corynespora cassiicola Philippines TaxID=1448308 RepID=A0A2T2P4F0_CORCC|nr:hypothetical protein BS50DRAFT_253455 [Corynespora cassiicola Philippines]
MSSIVHSISDLGKSVVELVFALFKTAGELIEKTFHFAWGFFSSLLNLFIEFFRGLVDLAGGIAQFIIGNVVMLAVLAVAFFGFLRYQRNQGKTVQVGNKKLN